MANVRLAAAAESLSSTWIPVCPATQDVIVTKYRKGFYNSDKSLLVNDLTRDIGLFGYCLRTLFGMAKAGKLGPATAFDITHLFNQVDSETLGRMLAEKPANISVHSIHDAGDQQMACLHHMLVSSVTTETLCEKAKFPKHFGFAAAFLRQLGLTLIAWNYPHVIRQALQSKEDGEDLDQALSKLLGYSPRALALGVGYNWGVTPELSYVLGHQQAFANLPNEARSKMGPAAEILSKSCEIGEILARASHPELYPASRGEWIEAKKRIARVLGTEGFSLIERQVKDACKTYVQSGTGRLALLADLPLGPPSAMPAGNEPNTNNECGLELSPAFREKLELLNRRSASAEWRKDNILTWAQELIPLAGFAGGSIFMFDFERSELIPRYRFGNCSLPGTVARYCVLEESTHPAALAFKAPGVIHELNNWSENDCVGHIAQTFGTIQKVGVLYLELAESHSSLPQEQVLEYFAIVRRTLMSCLALK